MYLPCLNIYLICLANMVEYNNILKNWENVMWEFML